MLKKTLRVLINTILVLLPSFSFLEAIFPVVDHNNLPQYLMVCGQKAIVLLAFAFYINYNNPAYIVNSGLQRGGWLLFLLAIIVMVPLHIGPPKRDAQLLLSADLEHLRFILLLLAVVVFAAGVLSILKPLWTKLGLIEKAIVVPMIIGIPIGIWDFYDSFTHGSQLTARINAGKKMDDFLPQYNFHQTWRAIGRGQLYLVAGWPRVVLYRLSIIKKWVMISICLFCIAGVGFCTAFVIEGIA